MGMGTGTGMGMGMSMGMGMGIGTGIGMGMGIGMAADEAGANAEEFIQKQDHKTLLANSPMYAELIKGGANEKEARDLITRKAAESAAILQGSVAAVGDKLTSKLVSGAFDNLLAKYTGKSALGKVATTGGISGLEEGIQETSEGVAADLAIQNVVKNKEIGEDSAANFILGAVGGAPTGGVRGLKTYLAEKFKDPNTTQEERQTILDSLTHGMEEPAGLFADQEGGPPAAPTGEESQRDKWAGRVQLDRNTQTVSPKYGDADQTLPPSNEPPGLFEDVDTGAATTAAPSAPAAPATAAPAQTLEAYGDFVRQYTELRDEYNSLPQGRIDQAGMNQRALILKDLAQVIDSTA
jgi:hypothetical protein